MTTCMSNTWKSIIFTYYSNSRFVLGVRGWKFSTKCSVQFVVFLDRKIVFFQEFCDDIMCMVLLVCQFWVFPNASAQLVKIVCTFVDEIASNLLCLLHAGQLMFPDPDVFSFHTPLISQCSLILFQFSWDSIKKRVYFCPFGSIILMYVYMNNWVKM